ncbi:hypothetical protein D3C76_1170670 [compost metagenome]
MQVSVRERLSDGPRTQHKQYRAVLVTETFCSQGRVCGSFPAGDFRTIQDGSNGLRHLVNDNECCMLYRKGRGCRTVRRGDGADFDPGTTPRQDDPSAKQAVAGVTNEVAVTHRALAQMSITKCFQHTAPAGKRGDFPG